MADDDWSTLPTTLELAQNYPNPFNPTTTIAFSLPARSQVNITIFNALGRVVTQLDNDFPAGRHEVMWDGLATNGTPVASGIYYYRIKANNLFITRKMILLK